MATSECLFPAAAIGIGEQHHASKVVYKLEL